MKQTIVLMSSSGHPSTAGLQGPPLAPSAVEATVVASAPSIPPFLSVQEVSIPLSTMVMVSISLVTPIVAPTSTIVTPLLSAGVTATIEVLASVSPLAVLALTSSSSSFDPNVGYRLEQRTPTILVSSFDKNLIQLVRVQNATDFANVFLQRGLAILE